MIYALIEYVNKYGKVAAKAFLNKETADEFVARLEKRKIKYLVTIL